MASRIVASGVRRANIPRRQELSRWNAALRALHAAGEAISSNEDPDVAATLALNAYGRLCALLQVPAPDLPALRTKLEFADGMVFRHEPELGVLFGAIVADARRLIL